MQCCPETYLTGIVWVRLEDRWRLQPRRLTHLRGCLVWEPVHLSFILCFQTLSSLCLENWHMSDLIDTVTLHFCWVQYSAALFSCWGAALYCATYSLSHGRCLHWCAEYPLKDWRWVLKVLTSGLWFVVFCPWASLSNFPQINTIAVHFVSKWAHSTQVMLMQNLLPAPVVWAKFQALSLSLKGTLTSSFIPNIFRIG